MLSFIFSFLRISYSHVFSCVFPSFFFFPWSSSTAPSPNLMTAVDVKKLQSFFGPRQTTLMSNSGYSIYGLFNKTWRQPVRQLFDKTILSFNITTSAGLTSNCWTVAEGKGTHMEDARRNKKENTNKTLLTAGGDESEHAIFFFSRISQVSLPSPTAQDPSARLKRQLRWGSVWGFTNELHVVTAVSKWKTCISCLTVSCCVVSHYWMPPEKRKQLSASLLAKISMDWLRAHLSFKGKQVVCAASVRSVQLSCKSAYVSEGIFLNRWGITSIVSLKILLPAMGLCQGSPPQLVVW